MGSTITKASHNLTAGTAFKFANTLPTDSGVDETVTYYVLASNLTADTFEFSDSDGGTAITLDNDISSADLYSADEYLPVTAAALDSEDPAYDPRLDPTVDAPMTAPVERRVTHSWPEAPGQPQNFVVAAAYKGLGARWDATSVGDLMFYEFRYAPDDGTGTGPDTELWVKHQVKTSVIFINGLTIDALYWCQVRSVDFSGQTVTSDVDATPVDYLSEGEAGWTASSSVTASSVPQEDVAFNSVLAGIVSANAIDASTITTGLLTIDTAAANASDGIRVYDTDVLIGYWDETGLYVSDAYGIPVDESNAIGSLEGTNYVRISDAGISVFEGVGAGGTGGGGLIDVLDATGLNASAITRGALPGGNNIIRNGSFEMAGFAAAPSSNVWTATADFTATLVSGTNAGNSDNINSSASGTYS